MAGASWAGVEEWGFRAKEEMEPLVSKCVSVIILGTSHLRAQISLLFWTREAIQRLRQMALHLALNTANPNVNPGAAYDPLNTKKIKKDRSKQI